MADWYEEFNRNFEKAMKASDALPDGLVVGKLFSMSVADGRAWYEVVSIVNNTVGIEWHEELCPDGYQDMALAEGGYFPRSMIERIVVSQEGFRKLMERHS